MPQDSRSVSPRQQKQAINSLVELRGFVCEWYEDTEGHRSGRSEEGRPAWLRLKTQLERADVTGVASYDLSRLYRNVKEFLTFIDQLESLGKSLLLCQELVDTSTASGRAVATMLVTMHQLQADRTSERVTANIEYRRRELGHHHGPIPFGCQRERGILSPATGEHAKDHQALLRAYALYTQEHLSYDRLAERMNTEAWQYRDRSGQPRAWNREDARRVLANHQLYAGHLPMRRDSRDQPTEVLYNTHTPIIDPDICAEVAREVASRRHPTQRGKEHVYLLGGLIHCATCKHKLAGYTTRGKRYYRHQGSKLDCPEEWQSADELEATFLQDLARLDDKDLFSYLHEYALLQLGTAVGTVLSQEIQASETRIQRISTLYLDGVISESEYHHQYREAAQQLTTLREQLPDSHALGLKDAIARLQDALLNLQGVCFERQYQVIRTLFARVDTRALCVVKAYPQEWLVTLWEIVEKWQSEQS